MALVSMYLMVSSYMVGNGTTIDVCSIAISYSDNYTCYTCIIIGRDPPMCKSTYDSIRMILDVYIINPS